MALFEDVFIFMLKSVRTLLHFSNRAQDSEAYRRKTTEVVIKKAKT